MTIKTRPKQEGDVVRLAGAPKVDQASVENTKAASGDRAKREHCNRAKETTANRVKNHRKLFEGTLDF